MKAWTIHTLDGIENGRLEEVADPTPGPGEVLLRVKYAGLNPADAYLAIGQYPAKPPLPHVLGRDGVGEVIALGSGVSGIQVGQTMVVLRSEIGVERWGTFAELVTVPTDCLTPLPAGWTEQQAAGAPLVYLTAFQAITQWCDLLRDAVVLISGASGGVGVASIQLAAAMGYTPVGLSRDPAKRETLKSLGCHLALDPSDPQWPATLKRELGKRRVDLVIDNIGGPLFPDLIATLGMFGRVSVVGRLAGEVPSFNTATLFFRRLRIAGVAVGTYTTGESQDAWEQIVRLLNQTNARPLVDETFPLTDLPKAFEKLARGPMGKVLVTVS